MSLPHFGARRPTVAGIPIVREFGVLLRNRAQDLRAFAQQAGVPYNTTLNWRKGARAPRLDLFIAALNALGYDLKIVRKGD